MLNLKTLLITGIIFIFSASLFGQSVTIDHVDGLVNPSEITADGSTPIVFHIRMTNVNDNRGGISNGFRIYSDDGATWGGLVGDTVGIGKAQFDGGFFISPFGVTGSGADTIGFAAFRFFSTGLPAAYDDIAYTITIGPIDPAHHGKTICIDSAFFPASGVWKWSGPDVVPSWEGLKCYTCIDPQVLDAEESSLSVIPENFTLYQNYPNPFNPNTTINLNIPTRTYVKLSVYNMLGQEIVRLLDKEMNAGMHTIKWDGKDKSGTEVATGIYLYRLVTDDYVDSKSMLILK